MRLVVTKMVEKQTEGAERRASRSGYIRTRPIAPGYDISWGDVIDMGKAMYEEMRAELEAKYPGQYVYIDVVSGAWEVAPDTVTAGRRLNKRFPDVKPWIVKIGLPDDD